MENYCIKPGYRNNAVKPSAELDDGRTYWNERRIASSYHFQHQVYRLARKLGRERNARTVLDLGCGVATKLNRDFGDFPEIHGIDQPSVAELCRQLHPRGRYWGASLEDPNSVAGFGIGPVDLLICADVIEHIENPGNVLEIIRKLTSPESLIVLSTPERDALLGKNAGQPGNKAHVREWAFGEFRTFLESSGFQVLDQRRLLPFRLGWNSMSLKYVLGRTLSASPLRTCQLAVCRAAPACSQKRVA